MNPPSVSSRAITANRPWECTRALAATVVAVLWLLGFASCPAQDVNAPLSESTSDSSKLADIIVTAQKQAELLKDVPISVSVISGSEISDNHVIDYDDISRAVPGVSIQDGQGPGLNNITIRGVSAMDGAATVGIYIDEVPVTIQTSFDGAVQPKLFDLDRIEVLRGPQGDLYGASSMGGTIRFITKQPDVDNFSALVGTDLSDTHHGGISNDEYGVLNVSVVKGVFALRISADLADQSGYVDHYIPTPTGAGSTGTILSLGDTDSTEQLGRAGVNDVHTQVFRIQGKYLAPDNWTVTPAFFWQRIAAADSALQYPQIGLYDQDKRVAEPTTEIMAIPSLTMTKTFGWADLIAVSSYFRRDFSRTQDGTYYNSNAFANYYIASPTSTSQQAYANATELAFLPSPVYDKTTTEQLSQELRLSSKGESIAGVTTTWTVGLFVTDQHESHTDYQYIPGLQAQFQQIFGYPIGSKQSPVGPTKYPGVSYASDLIYVGNYYPALRQVAPFGEMQFKFLDRLTAALGARYVSATETDYVVSGGFYSFGLPPSYSSRAHFSATTPRVSLDYAITDIDNIYITIAKGFRLGGSTGPDPANIPGGTCDADYASLHIQNPPAEYQSDSIRSYEVGSKGNYLDGRLTANASAYAINWTNIPQQVTLPTCGFSFTTNVGNARVLGSEWELRALAMPSLTLALSAGTTHGYITSVDTIASNIVSVGESILGVPKYSFTPSAEYEIPIGGDSRIFVRCDFPHTGRSRAYLDSSGVPHLFSPGYGVLNGSVEMTRNALKISLYAKNLLNWKNIIQYPSVNSVQEGYTVRPLTIGLAASLQL
jgi:iron complex outermembrane receptor protein